MTRPLAGLLCACCLTVDPNSQRPAVTIAQGSAMCAEHFVRIGLTYEVAEQALRIARRDDRVADDPPGEQMATYRAQHPRERRST